MEDHIIPLTQQGIKLGNKIFGAAILKKADLSLVIAETNNEIENPLWHGEIHTLKKFYELPKNLRLPPEDCIFFSTHEPCSLCLSAITWAGYDNFYYFFRYEETQDEFGIPHDLNILAEVFQCKNGEYVARNKYWNSYYLLDLISQCESPLKEHFLAKVATLREIYAALSAIYQHNKKDNDIPLS